MPGLAVPVEHSPAYTAIDRAEHEAVAPPTARSAKAEDALLVALAHCAKTARNAKLEPRGHAAMQAQRAVVVVEVRELTEVGLGQLGVSRRGGQDCLSLCPSRL